VQVLPSEIDVNERLVDAVISASRALVAVAARSLAGVGEEVTLPQYRALVVLDSRGGQRAADLAVALDVTPSTATRMCDRLVRKGLIDRNRPEGDRRALDIVITDKGRALVRQVTLRRRVDVARILEAMPAAGRPGVVRALRAFAEAAGEVPEQDWSLGWGK
jgi:DNA-binding MarR family transcriptional regulator